MWPKPTNVLMNVGTPLDPPLSLVTCKNTTFLSRGFSNTYLQTTHNYILKLFRISVCVCVCVCVFLVVYLAEYLVFNTTFVLMMYVYFFICTKCLKDQFQFTVH